MRPAGPERRVTRPTDVRLRGFAERAPLDDARHQERDGRDPDHGEDQVGRPHAREHAAPALLLDEAFVDELLVTLQHRQRIERVVGGDAAHGRQRVAVGQRAFQDHRDDAVAKLAIDRLVVLPVRVHAAFRRAGVVRCITVAEHHLRPGGSNGFLRKVAAAPVTPGTMAK